MTAACGTKLTPCKVVLVALFMACFPISLAASPLLLTQEQGSFPLSGHMQMLRDDNGSLTIENVTSPAYASRFAAIKGELAAGYMPHGAIWLRFTVMRPAAAPSSWILDVDPPSRDYIYLFERRGPHGFVVKKEGVLVPPIERDNSDRAAYFHLQIPSDTPQTYYVRIACRKTIIASLVIWPPELYFKKASSRSFIHGIYLGIFFMLIIINVICWIRIREIISGYYLGYVISLGIISFEMNGYLDQFFSHTDPGLAVAVMRASFAVFLVLFAGILSVLTDLGRHMPHLDTIYRRTFLVTGAAGIAAVLLGVHTQFAPVMMVMTLICTLSSIVIALRLLTLRIPGSGLYLLAFSPFLAVFTMTALVSFGLISGNAAHFSPSPFASLPHIILLNIAVATKLTNIKEQKDKAEATLITERKTIAEQRQFMDLIAHELRTPLSIIDGSAQLMVLSGRLGAEDNFQVKRILSGMKMVSDLLNNFLTDERIVSGANALNPAPENMRELIDECIADAHLYVGSRNVQCDIAALPEEFVCDRVLMKVLLNNLLDNALKYSPPQSDVRLRGWTADKGAVCLEVSDSGAGIEPHHIEQIFDRFYRASSLVKKGGAGLGLYLVKHIVQLHGGTVGLTSEQGHGSTFTVTLPVQPQKEII
ncbi:sensor histidine kinase [Candidatus Magnetominusculus xianensis]|uniref:histidine kinase n=1 Tax=Candidatus Magnetominusculus xianensis TaxID=1748249 RepID=A0ABR5SET2_9BACT|nr:sensor histidine kinase [Candidatus Magnetominusculus xianensis]KWT85017.1 histidine kinase [Candidatus Magnetominusculus xianensis]MBF0404515.1 sensor histidine kinase [Nitrospirota bacterium]